MIFLSDNGQDEYVNMLAQGHGFPITDSRDFVYEHSTEPIVLRGILKYKLMQRCWKDNRTFYYIDTGYFGNNPGLNNPRGYKHWHRIVKNNLQHQEIQPRPDDRWRRFEINFAPRRRGTKIVIAAPDNKPAKFYGFDSEQWTTQVTEQLQQYTDRPIIVRQRNKSRRDRTLVSPLRTLLEDDVHALVTFNSNAAVESILAGVPVFVLAPVHAARPVGNIDLSKIENPHWPDSDKLLAWASSLAYGQFHIEEFQQGKVLELL